MSTPETTGGFCPAECGGKREDCAAWSACACLPITDDLRKRLSLAMPEVHSVNADEAEF